MNKKIIVVILLCSVLISACAPSAEEIQTAIQKTQSAWTQIPTHTAYPTYTPYPTFTPIPVTNTPANTATPTVPPLFSDKGNGFYLVNVDIAPGVWRSNGTSDGCYWSVTSATGDIIENHFGQSGGTAFISPDAFQVEFNDCGTWSFVQAP